VVERRLPGLLFFFGGARQTAPSREGSRSGNLGDPAPGTKAPRLASGARGTKRRPARPWRSMTNPTRRWPQEH